MGDDGYGSMSSYASKLYEGLVYTVIEVIFVL